MNHDNTMIMKKRVVHLGQCTTAARGLLQEVFTQWGDIPVSVTGALSTGFSPKPLSDIPALLKGTKYLYPSAGSLLEMRKAFLLDW